MKKNKKQGEFLEQLRKIPIVLVACEKSGLSRNTIYRWRKEDDEFRKAMEAALREGEELVNDMSESQLLTMIKEKEWQAISFWLRHHHPTYANTLQIKHAIQDEELTPEQTALVREALRLATGHQEVITGPNQITHERSTDNPTESRGDNDQGQESQGGDH